MYMNLYQYWHPYSNLHLFQPKLHKMILILSLRSNETFWLFFNFNLIFFLIFTLIYLYIYIYFKITF